MFGNQGIPSEFKINGITINISKEKGKVIYRRLTEEDLIEKVVLGDVTEVLFTPVEPLNLPKRLTPYLLIQMDNSILIGPRSRSNIYLKFPIEIGCFLQNDDAYQMIDVFTNSKSKFTLYGHFKSGVICKYWESAQYNKLPVCDPLNEGVLKLNLDNRTDEWVEISKVVLNAFNIKMYYTEKLVSLNAEMVIKGPEMAEVDIRDKPLKKGMNRGIEVFSPRKLEFRLSAFTMSEGL